MGAIELSDWTSQSIPRQENHHHHLGSNCIAVVRRHFMAIVPEMNAVIDLNLKPHCIPIVIVSFGLRGTVPSLMVEGHSSVISRSATIVIGPHARATTKRLLHLGLRAGAASEISVAANGSEVRGGSGQVVIKLVAIHSCSRGVAVILRRVERRGSRVGAAVGRNNANIVVRRLPVNRGHALVKLGRVAELPLAEDGPEDGNSTD